MLHEYLNLVSGMTSHLNNNAPAYRPIFMILMQDGASPHTARTTEDFLRNSVIRYYLAQ